MKGKAAEDKLILLNHLYFIMISYCVGIDISKDHFHAAICTRLGWDLKFSKIKKWDNTKDGFKKFLQWVKKQIPKDTNVHFLMEATGVYHEKLAYFIHEKSHPVHIVLPNTSKHYFQSLNIKSKTDEIDARVLSQFGVERKHSLWLPPKPIFQKLRNLTRYKVQLQKQKNGLSNIGHSKEHSAKVDPLIIRANKRLIKQLNKEIELIKKEIEKHISRDSDLKERIRKISTIKGCGIQTAAAIIGETNGFQLFKSMKQLASYAGYDVVQHQSGSSVSKRGKISKKGNNYIRAALYLPALSASRSCPSLIDKYQSLLENGKIKMKGQVAVQRKLLLLIYTLWKSGEEYIPNYAKIKVAKANTLATQDSPVMALP